MKALRRCIAGILLAAAMVSTAAAQEEPVPAESSGGDPWVGYVGMSFLSAFILFLVCRSARRS
jgi:hypothetical protein